MQKNKIKVLIWCCGFADRYAGKFVAREAERQGYDVRVCGTRENPKLMRPVFDEYKPDVVFCFAIRMNLKPYYDYIKDSGAKLVFWYPDMTERTRDRMWRKTLNNVADGIFFSILETAQRYKDLAKTVVWMPQYFDYQFCSTTKFRTEQEPDGRYLPKRLDPSKPIYDLCFIGSCDKLRNEWLDKLEKMYKCSFHRDGIRNGKELRGVEMAQVYAQSKIAINIQRSLFKNSGSFVMSNRAYNAMGSGSFYINHHVTDIDKVFVVGFDCEMHNDTFEDLTNKIDFYLKEEEVLREVIAEQGQALILKFHTLEQRVKEYWTALEAIVNEDYDNIENGTPFGMWVK